jgi:hypothetical protein
VWWLVALAVAFTHAWCTLVWFDRNRAGVDPPPPARV